MKWVTRGFETQEGIFGIVEVKCLTRKESQENQWKFMPFQSYHLKVSADWEIHC